MPYVRLNHSHAHLLSLWEKSAAKANYLPVIPMVSLRLRYYSSEQGMWETNRKTSTTTLLQINKIIFKGLFQVKPFYDKNICSVCKQKHYIALFTCRSHAVNEPKKLSRILLRLLAHYLQPPRLLNTLHLYLLNYCAFRIKCISCRDLML